MSTKQYVTYLTPGVMFPEEEFKEVPDRSIENALVNMPKNTYAFYFTEATVAQVDDEILVGSPRNRSSTYYPGGKVFTSEELERTYSDDEHRILRSNCEYNGGKVVLCRTGNWQVFNEGDQITEEKIQ